MLKRTICPFRTVGKLIPVFLIRCVNMCAAKPPPHNDQSIDFSFCSLLVPGTRFDISTNGQANTRRRHTRMTGSRKPHLSCRRRRSEARTRRRMGARMVLGRGRAPELSYLPVWDGGEEGKGMGRGREEKRDGGGGGDDDDKAWISLKPKRVFRL